MRRVALACAAAVALSGAPANAGDTVYISGRVLDHTGTPVAGAHVSYELRPKPELYNQQDCPMRPWEIQCKVHKVAGRTDAAGRYKLPVKKTSFLATKRSHDLVITDRAITGAKAPARTAITMYFTGKSETIPDLPLWRGRAQLSAADQSGGRTLSVDAVPATLGRPYSTGPVVELMQGSGVAWRFEEVTAERRVDARVVETGTTGIRVSERRILGRLFPQYQSTVWAVSGALKPISRGTTCATYGRDDAVLPLSGCRFTDGRLATPIPTTYQRVGGKSCDVKSLCAHPKWVQVDLGAAEQVGAVAVRGCVPPAVEVSPDGTVWLPYPTHDFGDGLLVGLPLPARYVRVDLSPCAYKATEISVFAPA